VLVAPSSPMSVALPDAPRLTASPTCADSVAPEGLLQVLAQVPDPRDPRGVR
jgi:hypothetical protein